MHEFSLVKKEVESLRSKIGEKKVSKIKFSLGRLAHGSPESIRQAFKLATINTPLSEAELQFEIVEPKVKCFSCGNIFGVDKKHSFSCFVCGSTTNELVAGEECHIDCVEIED